MNGCQCNVRKLCTQKKITNGYNDVNDFCQMNAILNTPKNELIYLVLL